MPIIGLGFTKILAEKVKPAEGKIDIRNNVAIKNIEDSEVTLGESKQPGLKIIFEFTSSFDPNIGSIQLTGEAIYVGEQKELDEVLKGWRKNKKAPREFTSPILNAVLAKSNVEAIVLSRDIGLPPPIPLPKLRDQQP